MKELSDAEKEELDRQIQAGLAEIMNTPGPPAEDRAKFAFTVSASGNSINLNGVDITSCVNSLYLLVEHDKPGPQLILSLHHFDIEGDLDCLPTITLSPETRILLRNLGWTPPKGDE